MNLTRTSLIALTLAVGLGGQSALGEGWSLLPFSNSSQSAPPKESNEPSVWQKMNSGTKKFFDRLGDAFTFHKPEPKRQPYSPYNPWVRPTKKKKKESWFQSWFGPKEPEPPRSLSEWMELEPIRP